MISLKNIPLIISKVLRRLYDTLDFLYIINKTYINKYNTINPHRRASLPTKCLITIDTTHFDNSFEVPDESKPFSTYDTKHLFCLQLGKKQLKQPASTKHCKQNHLRHSWNSSTKILHTTTMNSLSTNSSEQKKKQNDFNKKMLVNVIKEKNIKQYDTVVKDKNKKKITLRVAA